MTATFVSAPTKKANAIFCPCGSICAVYDCPIANLFIVLAHDVIGEPAIQRRFSRHFRRYRNWFVDTFFDTYVAHDMKLFAQQISAVGMQQAMIIGMFMDAQNQLETQRLLNQLKNEAHRDYVPSEDFCWFGTGVRGMEAAQSHGRYQASAINARQMARHLGGNDQAAAAGQDEDKKARWERFRTRYCDPQDNGWTANDAAAVYGLNGVCLVDPQDPKRTNKDIDYTRMIEQARTISLDVDAATTDDLEDVFALGNNLYGHDVLSRDLNMDDLENEGYQSLYLALRSVAARRNVAESSFNAIVGLKTSANSVFSADNPETNTRQFLGAILAELGVPANEVYEYIGERPSYYAQLELLAKKIYQNPDFYANLYDKPANVARKSVALKAIELMLDRAIHESEMRQEMVSSVLLSTKLHDDHKLLNKKLQRLSGN